MQVQIYSFPIRCDKEENSSRPDVTMRIRKMISSATIIGEAIVNEICIDGANMLVCPMDAYCFSSTLAQKVRDDFLKEYELTGKSYREIDRYLDDNGLSIPDPTRFELGTITPDNTLRVSGEFKSPCFISFIGMSQVP